VQAENERLRAEIARLSDVERRLAKMEQSLAPSGARSTVEFPNSSGEKIQSSVQNQNKDKVTFTSPKGAPQPSAAVAPAQGKAKAAQVMQSNESSAGDGGLNPPSDAATNTHAPDGGKAGSAKRPKNDTAPKAKSSDLRTDLIGVGGGVCHQRSNFTSKGKAAAGANVPLPLTSA
jgi:hypothetical protein